MTESGQQQPFTQPSDWWSRRPRRSRTDSKVAGVAGGLGRYLGVDPILFRVGFVVLTVLGGAGVLAYSLCWLLLPADGDEVSAGESLIGRGRSSVSPILAVGLAIAVLITITSSFSWGLPFWPVAIAALIAFHIARKQRRGPFRPGSDWEARMHNTENAFRTGDFSGWPGTARPHQGWGNPGWGAWGGGWGCNSQHRSGTPADQHFGGSTAPTGPNMRKEPAGTQPAGTQPASPFDTPAFWEKGDPGATGTGTTGTPSTATAGTTSSTSPAPDAPSASFPAAEPTRNTPPAWDPLGAAPFAWDLPDIDLTPQATLVQTRRSTPAIYRATFGLAMVVAAVQIAGIMGGWWVMSWAAVSASALAVVAFGLLIQALSGRRVSLIAPGVLLSVITFGLTLTGLSGTGDVGNQSWSPTSAAAVQPEYHVSAGQARLDLSGLTALERGSTVTTSVDVNAGQAAVILPTGVNLNVTCSSNAGSVNCVGNTVDGFDNDQSFVDDTHQNSGTINLTVNAGAGEVVVSRG